jgi:hypothetical protein
MTWKLFDATYYTARHLGAVFEGIATGGNTITLNDTVNLTRDAHPDDRWNGGALWVLYDAGGAAAAPEKEFQRIIDFVQASSAVSLGDALTAAIASGDRYALSKPEHSLDDLIRVVNAALLEWGPKVATDTTSLTTATSQSEYTLPVANMKLLEVYIQTVTDDSNDNQWSKLYGWDVEFGATGSADKLIFPYSLSSGRKLKLVYTIPQAYLTAASDSIDEHVNFEAMTLRAAALRLEEQIAERGGADKSLEKRREFLMQRYENLKGRHRRPGRTPKLMTVYSS